MSSNRFEHLVRTSTVGDNRPCQEKRRRLSSSNNNSTTTTVICAMRRPTTTDTPIRLASHFILYGLFQFGRVAHFHYFGRGKSAIGCAVRSHAGSSFVRRHIFVLLGHFLSLPRGLEYPRVYATPSRAVVNVVLLRIVVNALISVSLIAVAMGQTLSCVCMMITTQVYICLHSTINTDWTM